MSIVLTRQVLSAKTMTYPGCAVILHCAIRMIPFLLYLDIGIEGMSGNERVAMRPAVTGNR